MRAQQVNNYKAVYGIISANRLFGKSDSSLHRDIAAFCRHLTVPGITTVLGVGSSSGKVLIHRRGRLLLHWRSGVIHVIDTLPINSGNVLGLAEALAGKEFEMNIQTLTTSDFDVFAIDDLIGLMRDRPHLCLKLANALNDAYLAAVNRIH